MQIWHIYAKIHSFNVKQAAESRSWSLSQGAALRKTWRSCNSLRSLKINFSPLQHRIPFSQVLSAVSQEWGDIFVVFCVCDRLKTGIPSPEVPGSLSLNSGQENTLTELNDIFAL